MPGRTTSRKRGRILDFKYPRPLLSSRRRGRDSNPGWSYPHNCLAGSPNRPLWHLSRYSAVKFMPGVPRSARDMNQAEGVGFEPTVAFRLQRFSRPSPSAARPSLRTTKRLKVYHSGWLCQRCGGGGEYPFPLWAGRKGGNHEEGTHKGRPHGREWCFLGALA